MRLLGAYGWLFVWIFTHIELSYSTIIQNELIRNANEDEIVDDSHTEQNVEHRLELYPALPLKGALFKRIDDTLNLTCRVIKLGRGPFFKWQLEWHLPQNFHNQKNERISNRPGIGNTLQLIIFKLQETDSGKYLCVARNDKSSLLQHSVELSILPRKKTCNEGMFSCSNPGICISRRYVCDGQKDCFDGADESQEICGESPCDGKLHCEDGRCISKRFCCDKYLDSNCTATYEIPCCKEHYLQPDFPIHTHQQYSEIGFLQSTMYSIIGCAVAFVVILSFTVVAVCRVHVRRSALTNTYAAYRPDPRVWSDLDTYLASNTRWNRSFMRPDLTRSPGLVLDSYNVNDNSANTLLVTYNINNGVQLVGRPIEPPPYEEVTSLTREEPPPPYASRENLNENQLQTGRNGTHAPFLSALFSLLINSQQMQRSQDLHEDNNNGDINGNSTGQVRVEANFNLQDQDVSAQSDPLVQLGSASAVQVNTYEQENSLRSSVSLDFMTNALIPMPQNVHPAVEQLNVASATIGIASNSMSPINVTLPENFHNNEVSDDTDENALT